MHVKEVKYLFYPMLSDIYIKMCFVCRFLDILRKECILLVTARRVVSDKDS